MKISVLIDDASFRSVCYLVEGTESSVLIDPSCDPQKTAGQVADFRKIKAVLITHGHFDHIGHVEMWKSLTDASIYIGREDFPKLSDPVANASVSCIGKPKSFSIDANTVKENDRLTFGDLSFEVLEVPGHTSGSVSYLITDESGVLHIFSGDLLFAGGGYGRTDLQTGSWRDLLRSVKKILTYPESSVIHPGHGDFTFTVGDLKKHFSHLT